MDKLCAIFANENLCVIYVTASEPTADKDAECRAELQEIMRIIGMKRKLVLSAIRGGRIITGITHRGAVGWWDLALVSFRESIDSLRHRFAFRRLTNNRVAQSCHLLANYSFTYS